MMVKYTFHSEITTSHTGCLYKKKTFQEFVYSKVEGEHLSKEGVYYFKFVLKESFYLKLDIYSTMYTICK